ncbi:MAG: DUF433 domain-containing protein [Candidatus Xenobia bacterium]
MIEAVSGYKHIVMDEQGRALIEGTSMKVKDLVLEHLAWDWGPGELKLQHPYLSLAQIHAAFAYYYDHQAAMDDQIEQERREVEALRQHAHATDPIYDKLRQAKRQAQK